MSASIPNGYEPADPELYRPDALELFDDPATTEVHPRVHTTRLVSSAWCARLLAEVDRIEAWCESTGTVLQRPNSMNDYGLILDQVGFQPVLEELVARGVRPLASRLFAELGGAALDEHHGFVVDYEEGRDEELGFHVDDSEVTLNLCLGDAFQGAELYFRGLRCERHRQTPTATAEDLELVHEPGVAVLHAGPHRHGVHSLFEGRRRNLIVWCRSSSYRAARERGACAPWCGARRERLP